MATIYTISEMDKVRALFPALQRTHKEQMIAFFDGPGGTQVPQPVIDAVSDYYTRCNSNTHGYFETSKDSDIVIHDAREKMSAFLGAESSDCVSFGANMTSISFSLSRAFSRLFVPGDEVLITQLDHEANRGPWLSLREHGIIIREVRLKKTGVLDYEDLREKINERTRLVCIGMASNLLGTVNEIEKVRQLTYEAGALLLVDAVHYAPHFPIDVQKLGVDFLLCSAYKFYGPHVGILYSKPDLLDRLQTDVLRTQDQRAPFRIETGTQNHAALQGVSAAVEFIAGFGDGVNLRDRLLKAMNQISSQENTLAKKLYENLHSIDGITVYGPDFSDEHRAPTLGFTVKGMRPEQVCSRLNEYSINAWDGHFYAIRGIEVLGLLEEGGLTRLGFSLYNTEQEVARVVEALHLILTGAGA